jgi:RHS repeat-associated protein
MLVPNRHDSLEDYRYGFQGQEKDDEIKGEGNSLNYTFRMHDPRVGRFFAVDPLTKSYPHYTPYSFSGNKVIHAIELEGLEEFEINGQASATFTFGTKGQSNFSVNAGFGGCLRARHTQSSLNLSLNVFNGGLGTTQGTTGQRELQGSLIVSPSLTIGYGNSNPLPINTFDSSSLSGVNDTFQNSFTVGQNFVLNTEGRNQRVGSYGLRLGNVNLNIANDTGKFLGDGFDRFFSGSGQVNIGLSGGGLFSFGSDVFTGDFGGLVAGSLDPDNPEGGRYGTYFQTKAQQNLNNGQAFFRLKTANGFRFGLNIIGDNGPFEAGITQDLIHDWLVPTPRFNYLNTNGSIQFQFSSGTK